MLRSRLWIGLRRGEFKLGFICMLKGNCLLIETKDFSTWVHAVKKLIPGGHTEEFFCWGLSKHQDLQKAPWVI